MARLSLLAAAASLAGAGVAMQLNIQDDASIRNSAGLVAKTLFTYHNPDSTVGQFNQPEPWFWWLSGSGWNGLMEYTILTGDTTYHDDILSALSKNLGDNYDFAPASQANWEANDDQVYWVYNALTAMEYNFTALPCEASGSDPCANAWVAIATHAFEDFVSRWNADIGTCNGGLKWQYNPANAGYTYKNSVTNGGFFQTAARLARYTGNQTFADWATKVWDWSTGVGLVSADFHVYDGAGDEDNANCSSVSKDEWSYNVATYMHGAAHMFAFTDGDKVWEERVQGLVNASSSKFFTPSGTGIMYEQKCEPSSTCTTDQTSFKASLARWMGKTAILVPSVSDTIAGLLKKTAEGVAASCVGYSNSTCGLKWTTNGFDGQSDFGVELSALEAVQSLLVINGPDLAVASK
ncbi:glycoside hydrolase family 76 protein [Xylariaceae sp. FL0016]|nr:glycoside hydrolase family 76 protein [Xylariaceae sp. FL0016]